MGKPAARLGDTTAHGSPLLGAPCPTVLIGGKPAWRIGDQHTCPIPNAPPPACSGTPHGPGVTTPVPDGGSGTCIIGGKPAARVGDIVMEPGAIIPLPPPNNIAVGEFTVLIGMAGGGGGGGGSPNLCQTTGHPVDVASGRVIASADDFVLQGTTPLVFRRFYSSEIKSRGPLGVGWVHNFQLELAVEAARLVLTDEFGAAVPLPKPPPGEMVRSGPVRVEADAHGYVVWRHAAEGLRFTKEASGKHLLTAIEDGAGKRLTLTHEKGRLRSVRTHTFQTLEFVYQGDRLTELREVPIPDPQPGPPRVVARYGYDANGSLNSVQDATGKAVTYAYDGGLLVRETDRNEFSFYFAYDKAGRCTHTWGDGGLLARTIAYDPERGLTRVVDSNGHQKIYVTEQGRTTKFLNSDGSVRTIDFDAHGRLVAQRDENGNGTQRVYDEIGRVVQLITPKGGETAYTHDDRDRVIAVETSDGHRRETTFDARGRRVAGASGGARWSYVYDDAGNVVRSTDPGGFTVNHFYDRWNRLSELRDDADGFVRFEYNAFGDVVALTDAVGLMTRVEYDALHRVVKTLEPDGTYSEYAYDGNSNLVRARDRLGNLSHYRMRFNLLLEMRQTGPRSPGSPSEVVYRFEYDNEGNLLAVHQPGDGATHFEYDDRNRVRLRTQPDGAKVHYRHDPAGNVIEIRTGADCVNYEYDEANNVIAKIGGDGERIDYEYDGFSRLTKGEYGDHVNELVYLPGGQLATEKADDVAIDYAYAPDGARTAVVPSAGWRVDFAFAPGGALRRIDVGGQAAVDLDTDLRGRLTRLRYGNGVSESREWDARDRLTRQTLHDRGARVLFQRGYAYDAADRLTQRRDQDRGDFAANYGPFGWIEGQRASSDRLPTGAFRYDGQGNPLITPTLRAVEYDAGDRVVEDADFTYEHDGLGRLSARTDRAGRRTTFAYNLNNQVARIEHPDGTVTLYEYDAFGRRVAKEHAGRRTRYLWDGHCLLQEWVPDEAASHRQYVQDPFRLTPAVRVSGDPTAATAEREYCHCDHLGGLTDLSGGDGTLVWSVEYDAFGSARAYRGDIQRIPLRRPGQYHDEETGLYYNRYRFYDPRLARFTTPDPLDLLTGFNLYKHPGNPLTTIDLNGLTPIVPVAGVHKIVDTNFLGHLLAFSRGKTSHANFAAAGAKAAANPNGLLVSPKVYQEFIGQDPSPTYRAEKEALMAKYNIGIGAAICDAADQAKFNQQKADNMANGMDANDSEIAAYCTVHNVPIVTNNAKDFRKATNLLTEFF